MTEQRARQVPGVPSGLARPARRHVMSGSRADRAFDRGLLRRLGIWRQLAWVSLKVFGLSLAGLRVWLALAVRATVVAGGLTARVAAGADVLSISQSRHSLEDVYLELIDHDKEASRRKEASRG